MSPAQQQLSYTYYVASIHSGIFDESYYHLKFAYNYLEKNTSNHGSVISKKIVILSFDEFFRHAYKCGTIVKFVKTTTVQGLLNQ